MQWTNGEAAFQILKYAAAISHTEFLSAWLYYLFFTYLYSACNPKALAEPFIIQTIHDFLSVS